VLGLAKADVSNRSSSRVVPVFAEESDQIGYDFAAQFTRIPSKGAEGGAWTGHAFTLLQP